MKVAYLVPYLPFPPDRGGKIRSFHLLRSLASIHEVHVFAVASNDPPEAVSAVRNLCSGRLHLLRSSPAGLRLSRTITLMPHAVLSARSPRSLSSVRQELRDGAYDLIIVDELAMAPYAAKLDVPRVLLLQKIDHRHYWERALADRSAKTKLWLLVQSAKLRWFEGRTLADGYRCCVVCSDDDRRIIERINPHIPVRIMPNGVDGAYFAQRTPLAPSSRPTLMFTGTMSYDPNVDAMLHFCEKIFPLILRDCPGAQLFIVGHDPPPSIKRFAQSDNVVVTGSVADIRPYLGMGTVMVVPLRLGGGTRLKILEAMATGLPVISTLVGCQGLAVASGRDILIANDPGDFAAAALSLLRNPEQRSLLSTNGRQTAARYDWNVLVPKLVEDITPLIAHRPAGGR